MLKKINVLGKDYKILKNIPKKWELEINEAEFMGLCFDMKASIFVNPELTGEDYWTTLFHEVGHAVMYRSGVRNSGAITKEVEEIIVETMANVNYVLFKEILKAKENKVITL